MFLVIDGWSTMQQDFEDLEQQVQELAARGLSFGVHVVVTAIRWSEMRTWLRDLLGTKLELRLGDPMESEVGSRKAATVPNQPGRGLTGGGLHFLAALPRLDGSSARERPGRGHQVGGRGDRHVLARPDRARRCGCCRPSCRSSTLPPRRAATSRSVLGRDEQRLAPVWHDFMATPHLLVFGDSETGKTNVLRLVLRAIQQRYTPERGEGRARRLAPRPGHRDRRRRTRSATRSPATSCTSWPGRRRSR